jgi:3-methyladenine DNA glycosylase AlkC
MSSSPQAFKLYFDGSLARDLGTAIQRVHPRFDIESFVRQVDAGVGPLELKARVALITDLLHEHLSLSYPEAIDVLVSTLPSDLGENDGMFNDGFQLMPIAFFVERYGLEHFDESVHAMYEITKRHTAEFTIRPFIERYQERLWPILERWTEDPSHDVRRLVSEGTRPRLPWAGQLRQFIAEPGPVIDLLERLRNDESAYVRRSVGNNFNDIAKDHPERVLEVARRWSVGATPETQWIIGRALRSLVKQGHPDALAVLGYRPPEIGLNGLSITPPEIDLGEAINVAFELTNAQKSTQDLVIDLVLHLVRANGKAGRKVFKFTTTTLAESETRQFSKTLNVRPVTTRRYYAGLHRVDVQVNGVVLDGADFVLRTGS